MLQQGLSRDWTGFKNISLSKPLPVLLKYFHQYLKLSQIYCAALWRNLEHWSSCWLISGSDILSSSPYCRESLQRVPHGWYQKYHQLMHNIIGINEVTLIDVPLEVCRHHHKVLYNQLKLFFRKLNFSLEAELFLNLFRMNHH